MSERKVKRFVSHPAAWRLAMAVAVVSGLFCLIVCVLLIANYIQIRAIDPINQPELLELRTQLNQAPETDPELVAKVRAMDLLARKAFFTSQAHLRMGAYLLLGGAIVSLIALKLASRWSARPPVPPETPPSEVYWSLTARAKELVAFGAVALVTAALLAAYLTPLDVPPVPTAPAADEAGGVSVTESAFPDWEALQRQWPSFRGPGGYGVAFFDTAPTEWDVASGKNIKWKVEAPGGGFNSPVVWDNHLFLSVATEDVREVLCYDTETGALRWKSALPAFPGTPAEPPKVTEDTGYAAPTMVVHGERACAIFANGDIACYDFAGNLRWGKNLGVPDNHYGHSSSLIALGEHIFVQFDDKKNPRVIALNADTGEEAWATPRKTISWASPACIQTTLGPQLILNNEKDVDAYDPTTGRALWTLSCLSGEVAPSPAWAANTIFVANEYAMATAIRLDLSGSEPKAAMLWEWDEALPEVSSPVGSDTHFYIATSMAEVYCLDINTGEKAWSHEFDEGFYSSPIRVADRVYVLDLAGAMHIFKTGPAFELVASNAFDERCFATPAYLDGRVYARTEGHLICIEEANVPQ